MQLMKNNKVFYIVIILSLVVALAVSVERINIESQNKNVDVILDFTELNELAKQSNEDVSVWLNLFKEQGINKVGLSEESLYSLMEEGQPVKAEIMEKVVQDIYWADQMPQSMLNNIYSSQGHYDPNDVLITTSSEDLFNFIEAALKERYGSDRYFSAQGEHTYYILLDGSSKDTLYESKEKLYETNDKPYRELRKAEYSKLMYLSLGFDQDKLKKVNNANMQVIPRTVGLDGWNGTKFEKAVVKEYNALKETPEYILFAGLEIIGQDDGSDNIKAYINTNHIKVGVVESTFQRGHNEQTGLQELIKASNYNMVRTFTTWNYIQNRYQYYNYPGAEEIENTFFRAITERNIRLIYFKPIKEFKDHYIYVTNKDEYKEMFENLKNRISEHNITFGSASVMPPYNTGIFSKVLITLGTVAGSIILLSAFVNLNKKYMYGLMGLGTLGAIGAFVVSFELAELISALAASIVFPSLAIYYLLLRCRYYQSSLAGDERLSRIIAICVKELVIISGISAIGALLTSSVIADIDFLLELSFFRGVKLAQLGPIVIFLLLYLSVLGSKASTGNKFEINGIKGILTSSIQVWVVLVAGIVLAAGYIYIARTGHETAIEPMKIEMIFRNFLEEKLLARPRNKEFLIAFPALMLTIFMVIRRLKSWLPCIFGIAAVIGQTSIVNTFMHMRTPMYMSIIRTGYSLLFGIVLGVLYLLAFELLLRIINRVKGEA